MAHDIFISYASYDKTVADAACAAIEAERIRCWIAPRDVLPGTEYGEAIVDAISECRAVVLVFSTHANDSPHIRREVERAVSKSKIIVPFRIEDVLPSRALEFCLGNTHWLDAMTPPLEQHIAELVTSVGRLLGKESIADGTVGATLTVRESGLPPEWGRPLETRGLDEAIQEIAPEDVRHVEFLLSALEVESHTPPFASTSPNFCSRLRCLADDSPEWHGSTVVASVPAMPGMSDAEMRTIAEAVRSALRASGIQPFDALAALDAKLHSVVIRWYLAAMDEEEFNHHGWMVLRRINALFRQWKDEQAIPAALEGLGRCASRTDDFGRDCAATLSSLVGAAQFRRLYQQAMGEPYVTGGKNP